MQLWSLEEKVSLLLVIIHTPSPSSVGAYVDCLERSCWCGIGLNVGYNIVELINNSTQGRVNWDLPVVNQSQEWVERVISLGRSSRIGNP